jgi:hypothetical protein
VQSSKPTTTLCTATIANDAEEAAADMAAADNADSPRGDSSQRAKEMTKQLRNVLLARLAEKGVLVVSNCLLHWMKGSYGEGVRSSGELVLFRAV